MVNEKNDELEISNLSLKANLLSFSVEISVGFCCPDTTLSDEGKLESWDVAVGPCN